MYFLIPGTAEDFIPPTAKVVQITKLNPIQLLDSLLRAWYLRSDETDLYNTLAEWIYDEFSYEYYVRIQTTNADQVLQREFDAIFNELSAVYQRLDALLTHYPLPFQGNVMLFIAEYVNSPYSSYMLLKALPTHDS